MRKHVFILFSLLFAWVLTACTPTDRFDAGHPIDREELASISAAVFETVGEPDAGDTYPKGTVHWTQGGSVYHTDAGCYHLKRADEVLHGTVGEAEAAGKEKLCATCEKSDE